MIGHQNQMNGHQNQMNGHLNQKEIGRIATDFNDNWLKQSPPNTISNSFIPIFCQIVTGFDELSSKSEANWSKQSTPNTI